MRPKNLTPVNLTSQQHPLDTDGHFPRNVSDSKWQTGCKQNECESNFSNSAQNTSIQTSMDISNFDVVGLYRIVIPIFLFACLLSFLSNLLIVCSARWIRRRRLSPNLLLSLSLAGADAFASLIVGLKLVLNNLLPIALGVQLGQSTFCLMLALDALHVGSLVSTALHLLALAVNHHVGISNPLHYARIITRKNTLLTSSVIWVCPITFFFVYFSSVAEDGFQSPECSSYVFLLYSPFRVTTAVLFFVPLIAMTAIYIHIFLIARRHQPQNNSSPNRPLKRNIKAIVTTLLLLGAYVLGSMPTMLYFTLTCLDCLAPLTEIPARVRVLVSVFNTAMAVARCMVDPVLYLVRMPEVRDALLNMFCVQTSTSGNSSNPSSLQNARMDMQSMSLVPSQRKINVYAMGESLDDW